MVPNAAIHVGAPAKDVIANDSGVFSIPIPEGQQHISLHITGIGINYTGIFTAPFNKQVAIYVDVASNGLKEFAIKALSAEDVVKMAVASIPNNYADSSYFDHSFYRRYQEVNNRYENLCEASPVVMFRLSNSGKQLVAAEAFAVTRQRRSRYYPDIMNAREDNPADLLPENPVYHLYGSSLQPGKFTSYRFEFDTTANTADYVIRYTCNDFSTDHHGIAYYDERDLKGEASEEGELIIERGTFAIKKISRKSLRHKDYIYKYVPMPNNQVVYANHKYFFEFTGGDLEAEYKQHHGKWYLNRICRRYTNEFYTPLFNEKAFVITDNFEWYSGEISRYTTDEYIDKFFPIMATAIHNYDQRYWREMNVPFFFANKASVYHDLQLDGDVEEQFYNESKLDPYPRKPRKTTARDKTQNGTE